MYIRPAERADEDVVTQLWLAMLDEQAEAESRFDAADDAEQRWRNDYPAWIDDETRRVLVADRDGEIDGFVTAMRWAPAPVYAFSEEIYVNEFYVRPPVRKQGLGRRLMLAVREWAGELGADRIRMDVLAANEQGRAFWSAIGARPMTMTYALELESSAKTEEQENKRGKLGF